MSIPNEFRPVKGVEPIAYHIEPFETLNGISFPAGTFAPYARIYADLDVQTVDYFYARTGLLAFQCGTWGSGIDGHVFFGQADNGEAGFAASDFLPLLPNTVRPINANRMQRENATRRIELSIKEDATAVLTVDGTTSKFTNLTSMKALDSYVAHLLYLRSPSAFGFSIRRLDILSTKRSLRLVPCLHNGMQCMRDEVAGDVYDLHTGNIL